MKDEEESQVEKTGREGERKRVRNGERSGSTNGANENREEVHKGKSAGDKSTGGKSAVGLAEKRRELGRRVSVAVSRGEERGRLVGGP